MTRGGASSKLYGNLCETWACLFLLLKGYAILQRQFIVQGAEVDIIAKRGSVVAFVEVKARKSHMNALEAVDFHKKRRMFHAAHVYLARRHDLADCALRFDILAINRYGLIRHEQQAFEPEF